MTQIRIKRVYEDPEPEDGYRVLVDRLWPRGMSKEHLHYDAWEKEITPSTQLREWFHEDEEGRWPQFAALYEKELENSSEAEQFAESIRNRPVVTLLYASKDTTHNHAQILEHFLQEKVKG